MRVSIPDASGWEIFYFEGDPTPQLDGPDNVNVVYYAKDERWPEHLHIEHDAYHDGTVSVTIPVAAIRAFMEALSRRDV